MDKLKSILIKGFGEHATRIKLTAGEVPEGMSVLGTRPLAGEQPISGTEVQQLFQFLMPNEGPSIKAGKVCKGALNIPGKGKVLLIAQPGPPVSLRMYLPPDGPQMFEQDWVKINSQTVTPAMATPPNNVFAPTGGGHSIDYSQPPLGSMSGAIGGVGFNPPPEPSMPFEPVQDDGMGMPPPFDEPSNVGGLPPLEMASPPPLQQNAQARAFAASEPPPMADMPPEMPPSMAANMQPRAAPRPAQPMVPAHASSSSDDIPRIEFKAEKAGSSIVSDGQFPIDRLFRLMVENRASDLHMTMGERVCFRIDGSIHRVGEEILTPESMEAYLMPTMPIDNQKEFATINDTDYAYEVRGVGRFRVNIYRDRNGVGAVMRHIPSKILTSAQLNLPSSITQFCRLTKGLVLVTGPTGSGKSTTLAAMLDEINKTRDDHILTIEDPIEFVHPQQMCLVNQREIGRHTNSFKRALKAALREDPDVVLIGEMRDLETIAIAIETAETGHLVFGTLHTTTAIGTIDRIIDQFPADQQEQVRMMLASSLKGVVAQTLLKKKGGGRVAAHEILVSDDAIAAMVREGKNHMIANHMQSQKKSGNQLLNDCLANLVRQGTVDVMEAFVKCVDKKGFVEVLKRIGIQFNPNSVELAS